MARIRTIKPAFWTDEKLATISRANRLTFIGVISACADDDGRFKANPKLVRAAIYPLDDDVASGVVEGELAQLVELELLRFYDVKGERYGVVVNWYSHQRIEKKSKSILPAPPDGYQTPPVAFREGNRKAPTPEAEAEREVEAEIGSGAGARSEENPLARWLARFYGDAGAERQAEVRAQLAALWQGESVKLKQTPVKAKNTEHLTRKAAEMLEVGFTLRDKSKAIVILLQKLGDPEKDANGNLPGEAMAAAAKREEQLADVYETDRKKAIAVWEKANPAEVVTIEDAARSAMTTAQDNIGYRSELTARKNAVIIERMAFPDFEHWLQQRKAS